MKVLVIDDSKIIRNRIVGRLRELNTITGILEAENAQTAFQLLKSEIPDKVLLDLRLPDKSGIDILKWIREQGIQTDVIVLTNYPYPEYERKCRQYGASHFLDKSSDFDQVIELLA